MYIVTAEEMRKVDQYAIEKLHFTADMLMENAGRAITEEVIRLVDIGSFPSVVIVAGSGNNGGDGIAVARNLMEKGFNVELFLVKTPDHLSKEASRQLKMYEASGYSFKLFSEGSVSEKMKHDTLLIDALLGTGISGELREPYRSIIPFFNTHKGPVVSIDIPSVSVQADYTITIMAPKLEMFLFPFADYCGEIITVDIGIPSKAFKEVNVERYLIGDEKIHEQLPVRVRNSHKSHGGKGLIIGGSRKMIGAPLFSARACVRSGAGLLTMAVPESITSTVAAMLPEAMYFPLEEKDGEIRPEALSLPLQQVQPDAVAIGPGMGRNEHVPLHELLFERKETLILDADALYHLGNELNIWKEKKRKNPVIITPHPGEMAFLLQKSIKEIEENRFSISREFATTYGMYVVLKGPFTIVTAPSGEQWVNSTGNGALAKGGSGDILTGMLLALTMQVPSILDALCQGVFLHGRLAEYETRTKDPIAVTGSDLIEAIPYVLKEIRMKTRD